MAAIPIEQKTGPDTFVPAELILGGQVVEARSASRVGVAAAGSLKTLGVAVTDGVNPEALTAVPTVTNGLAVLDAGQRRPLVSVANSGMKVPGVTFVGAAAFGDKLKAAAAGGVTPLQAGDDSRMEVGTCVEPAGVAAGATGRVRIK